MIQDTLIGQNMGINISTKMNNKKIIIDFAKIIIFVDFCIVSYSLFAQDINWLLNTQVAFFGSLFIILASFLSYKKNVKNRLSSLFESSDETKIVNDRDKIDEIDDPYDLYSENEEILNGDDLSSEDIKKIIKEEKEKIKRNSFKNVIFSAGSFTSIYRILGYGFLILGFLILNNNSVFLPTPFLLGLGIVPISIFLSKFILKLGEDQ